MKVILGLGNPGARYAGTRHNIGIRVVERLAERWGVALSDRKTAFEGGAGVVAGVSAYLAVSRVFMNLSGEAARALYGKMGRVASNLITVQDDIDLPVGRVRLKEGGGDGGHKGVRSVCASLVDRDFFRVRVGVGHPGAAGDVSRYVLERFPPDEKTAVAQAVETAADAVEMLLKEGLLAAQASIHSLR